MKLTKNKIVGVMLAIVVLFTIGYIGQKNFMPEITATTDENVILVDKVLTEDIESYLSLGSIGELNTALPDTIKIVTVDGEELDIEVKEWIQKNVIEGSEEDDYISEYIYTPYIGDEYKTDNVTLPEAHIFITTFDKMPEQADTEDIVYENNYFGYCSCGELLTENKTCSVTGATKDECSNKIIAADVDTPEEKEAWIKANGFYNDLTITSKTYEWFSSLDEAGQNLYSEVFNKSIKNDKAYIYDCLNLQPINTVQDFIDHQSEYNLVSTFNINNVLDYNGYYNIGLDNYNYILEKGWGDISLNDIYVLAVAIGTCTSDDGINENIESSIYEEYINEHTEKSIFLYDLACKLAAERKQTETASLYNNTYEGTSDTYSAYKYHDAGHTVFGNDGNSYSQGFQVTLSTLVTGDDPVHGFSASTGGHYYCAAHHSHCKTGANYEFGGILDKYALGEYLYNAYETASASMQVAVWQIWPAVAYNGSQAADANAIAHKSDSSNEWAIIWYRHEDEETPSTLPAPGNSTNGFSHQPLVQGLKMQPEVYIYFDINTNAASPVDDVVTYSKDTNVPGHRELYKSEPGASVNLNNAQSVNIDTSRNNSVYGWQFCGWSSWGQGTDTKNTTVSVTMPTNLSEYSTKNVADLGGTIYYKTVYAVYKRQITLNVYDYGNALSSGTQNLGDSYNPITPSDTGTIQTYTFTEYNTHNTQNIRMRKPNIYVGGQGNDNYNKAGVANDTNGWQFEQWNLYTSTCRCKTSNHQTLYTKGPNTISFGEGDVVISYEAQYKRLLVFKFDRNIGDPATDKSWQTSSWKGYDLEDCTVTTAYKHVKSMSITSYKTDSWKFPDTKYRNACTHIGYADPWDARDNHNISDVNQQKTWAKRASCDLFGINKTQPEVSWTTADDKYNQYQNDHTFYCAWQLDTTSVTATIVYNDESDRYKVRPSETFLLILRDGTPYAYETKDGEIVRVDPNKTSKYWTIGLDNRLDGKGSAHTSSISSITRPGLSNDYENLINKTDEISLKETFNENALNTSIAKKYDDYKNSLEINTNPLTDYFKLTQTDSYGEKINTTPNNMRNNFTYIFDMLQEKSEIDNHTYRYTIMEAFTEPENAKLQYSVQYTSPKYNVEGQNTIIQVSPQGTGTCAGQSILKSFRYLYFYAYGVDASITEDEDHIKIDTENRTTEVPISTIPLNDSSVTIYNNLNEPDIYKIHGSITIDDENDKYNLRPDFIYLSLYKVKVDAGEQIISPEISKVLAECVDTEKIDIQYNSLPTSDMQYVEKKILINAETEAVAEEYISVYVRKTSQNEFTYEYYVPYLYFDYDSSTDGKGTQYAYFVEIQTDYEYVVNGTIYPYTSNGEYSANTAGSKTYINKKYLNTNYGYEYLGTEVKDGNQYRQDLWLNSAINSTVNNFTMPYYKETQNREYIVQKIEIPYEDGTIRQEYHSDVVWNFNYNLNGSGLMPNTYSGSISPDDITGMSNDFWHTANHIAISNDVDTDTRLEIIDNALIKTSSNNKTENSDYLYNQSNGGTLVDDMHIYNKNSHTSLTTNRTNYLADTRNYNNLLSKEKNECFLITLKQIKKYWTGCGSDNNLQENYSLGQYTGNTYNIIVQANGITNIQSIPDGMYEVEIPHEDIDFKYEGYIADEDFINKYKTYNSSIYLDACITENNKLYHMKSWIPQSKYEDFDPETLDDIYWYDFASKTYNSSQLVEVLLDTDAFFYDTATGKYYIVFGSEYYDDVTGIKTLMKIDNWRGYVNDQFINNTSLRTSDFATDVDFNH